jgi:hypothetical protein
VPDKKRDNMSEEGTCAIHVAESRFEAEIITAALEREGITVICKPHEETAYNGIFVPQKGWGKILVPLSDRDRAEEIAQEVCKVYGRKTPTRN